MAMESFFMDELQIIKNESLTSAKIRNTWTNIDNGISKSISHTFGSDALQNDKKNESNVPNYDTLKKLQFSFKDLHPEAHQPKVKNKIVVIGDSIIKNVNGRDVSRGDLVKTRLHPRTSTEDLIDHIKPTILKKIGIVVIHTGTDDLQNNCNIVEKVKKLLNAVK